MKLFKKQRFSNFTWTNSIESKYCKIKFYYSIIKSLEIRYEEGVYDASYFKKYVDVNYRKIERLLENNSDTLSAYLEQIFHILV